MRSAWFRVLTVCALVPALLAVPVSDASGVDVGAGDAGPTVEAAYPNPVAGGDAGEFVRVSIPDGVDPGRYALTDGSWRVSLADVPTGTVAVADHRRAANRTDHPVVVRDDVVLANGGERLRIERRRTASGDGDANWTTVDAVSYREAPEGELAVWNGSAVDWRIPGRTDRPVVSAGPGTVEAFVLPDAPSVPIEHLRGAEERILLAGYTLTSERVTRALVAARQRNVTVRVLLEGEPVGERMRAGARALDRLADAGVEVRVLAGPNDRYAYHHPKYAVVDDRALVATENWKPAGTGGADSRGWGVVTGQRAVVSGLATTFRADADGRDARPWEQFRRGRTFERGESAAGDYATRHAPETVRVNGTDLLVAPDNAGDQVVREVDAADESLDVVQVTLGDWDDRLPRALRRAAARGVSVRLLLSDAWYVREDNVALRDRFREWAGERDAALTVRLADPGDRFGKIHAKGAIVDDERVLLGSLNWNDQAAAENREVVLVLQGRAIADYYAAVFDGDWPGGGLAGSDGGFPLGLLAAVAGAGVIAALVLRRIDFEGSGVTDDGVNGVAPTDPGGTAPPTPGDGDGGRPRANDGHRDRQAPNAHGDRSARDTEVGSEGRAPPRRGPPPGADPDGHRSPERPRQGGAQTHRRRGGELVRPPRRRDDERENREDSLGNGDASRRR